jgi:hypothetical protein
MEYVGFFILDRIKQTRVALGGEEVLAIWNVYFCEVQVIWPGIHNDEGGRFNVPLHQPTGGIIGSYYFCPLPVECPKVLEGVIKGPSTPYDYTRDIVRIMGPGLRVPLPNILSDVL